MSKLGQNLKYFIIASGIVLIWRGIWGLADIYLFPDDLTLSFAASIAIGIVLLLLVNWSKRDISELFGR